MKKVVVFVAVLAVVLSSGSVNAFTHDKLQKQLEDATKQIEQQMQGGQQQQKIERTQGGKEQPGQKSIPPVSQNISGEEAYNRGKKAYSEKNYKETARYWNHGAKLDHTASINALAYLYMNGIGIEKNGEKAFSLASKAADRGFAKGQRNVGVMYEKGIYVKQNLEEAAKWYKLSADQGDQLAINDLKRLENASSSRKFANNYGDKLSGKAKKIFETTTINGKSEVVPLCWTVWQPS